uniref:Uncharacterized protein n=1 Tax=Oryza rufipogon TaxID=4529 RepID=A0A0E0R307_ORYRU
MWESNDDTLVIESAFSCFSVAGSSSQGLCGWFVLIASEFLMELRSFGKKYGYDLMCLLLSQRIDKDECRIVGI